MTVLVAANLMQQLLLIWGRRIAKLISNQLHRIVFGEAGLRKATDMIMMSESTPPG